MSKRKRNNTYGPQVAYRNALSDWGKPLVKLRTVSPGVHVTLDGKYEVRYLEQHSGEGPWSVYETGKPEPLWLNTWRRGWHIGVPTMREARFGLSRLLVEGEPSVEEPV